MLLKESIKINSMTSANRLVMPPMITGKADDGKYTPEMVSYYTARSGKGAVGLIITECSAVTAGSKLSRNEISIADDSVIPSHRMLTDAVHKEGSLIAIQLHHAGPNTAADLDDPEIVGPSAVLTPFSKPGAAVPRALTVQEIREIEDIFVQAAVRSKEAGYDAVELHCAHSYLLNHFYSPLSNKRTDEYGGPVENRIRMTVEITEKVRKTLGPDFPIIVRLGGCDYFEGGSTIQDAVDACVLLEKAGADMLDLSGGLCGFTRKDVTTPGWFDDMTSAVKKAVSIPVMLTGGVTSASEAEALLQEGAADMIGVGRAIFKDETWAAREMA